MFEQMYAPVQSAVVIAVVKNGKVSIDLSEAIRLAESQLLVDQITLAGASEKDDEYRDLNAIIRSRLEAVKDLLNDNGSIEGLLDSTPDFWDIDGNDWLCQFDHEPYKTHCIAKYERKQKSRRVARNKSENRIGLYGVDYEREMEPENALREWDHSHRRKHHIHTKRDRTVFHSENINIKDPLELERRNNAWRLEYADGSEDYKLEIQERIDAEYLSDMQNWGDECGDPLCEFCHSAAHNAAFYWPVNDSKNDLYEVGVSKVVFFDLKASGEDTIEALKNLKFVMAFIRSIGGSIGFRFNPE